ncbi:unnamed protein product [Schistocephalus solidus]|uniref:Calcium activated potassium channel subunit n=1 Tax=Schistocephalus solidus TaxID=70667 RepID=A0A183S8G4_SCHSO|nr:unnamed protein product [Schistocephalus solidus]
MTCGWRKLKRATSWSTAFKVAYICSAALLTTSLIIAVIIIRQVIWPYAHENQFELSLCRVTQIEEHLPILMCENRCSKERSFFPCLRVEVIYEKNGSINRASLFDTIGTHESYHKYRCVTHACQHRFDDNKSAIELFRNWLQRNPEFNCFVSAGHGSEALLRKCYRFSTVALSIGLPGCFIFVALGVLGFLCQYDQCKVWNNEAPLVA